MRLASANRFSLPAKASGPRRYTEHISGDENLYTVSAAEASAGDEAVRQDGIAAGHPGDAGERTGDGAHAGIGELDPLGGTGNGPGGTGNGPGGTGNGPRSRGSAEVVYERLRSAIINGELAQAAVLSQVELARRFGVSRTPLREALRMLQAEGFVHAELNRKVRVAPFSVEDLEQLYAARIVLECLGISLSVPQLTDDDFAELHRCLDQMDEDAERRDFEGWERPHADFHRQLVAYSSQRTISMIRQLADGARRYRRVYISEGPGVWRTTAVEHRAILAACEARDSRRAATELARHFARTALTVIAMVDPSHDPAPVRAALALVAPEGSDAD